MSSICDYPLNITKLISNPNLNRGKFHINLSTVTTIVLTLVDSHNYLVHPPHCFTVWVSHHLSPPSLLSAPPHTPSHSLSPSTVTPTSSHWHHCASYCVTVYPLHQPSVTSILLCILQLRHPHPLFRFTVYPSTQAPSPHHHPQLHTLSYCVTWCNPSHHHSHLLHFTVRPALTRSLPFTTTQCLSHPSH